MDRFPIARPIASSSSAVALASNDNGTTVLAAADVSAAGGGDVEGPCPAHASVANSAAAVVASGILGDSGRGRDMSCSLDTRRQQKVGTVRRSAPMNVTLHHASGGLTNVCHTWPPPPKPPNPARAEL